MERPRPKELVIRYAPSGQLIHITATTNDARGWIEREAPGFGDLGSWRGDDTMLFVSAAYDAAEVAAWLNTYS